MCTYRAAIDTFLKGVCVYERDQSRSKGNNIGATLYGYLENHDS